jgi:hypothetical protein
MANISRTLLKDLYDSDPTNTLWDGLVAAYFFDNSLVDSENGYTLTPASAGTGTVSVDADGLHLYVNGSATGTDYAGAYYDGGSNIFADPANLELSVMVIGSSNSSLGSDHFQGCVVAGADAVTQSTKGFVLSNMSFDTSQTDYHSFMNRAGGTAVYAPTIGTQSNITNNDQIMSFNRTRASGSPVRSVRIIEGSSWVFDTDDAQESTSAQNSQYATVRDAERNAIQVGSPFWVFSWQPGPPAIKRTLGSYLAYTFDVRMILIWERYVEDSEFVFPRSTNFLMMFER